MDYEKLYREANIKVAIRFGSNVAKELFPDLYESKDERIRKSLESTKTKLNESMIKHDPYPYWTLAPEYKLMNEQKPAWSEEDIVAIGFAVEVLNKDLPSLAASIERLKSLRPQSQWKPSEEQMKILNEVLNFAANHENPHWNDYIFGTLNNLIRQLKKLRKE